MTTMKRLLDDPSSDLDRILLESAMDEEPPPGAADKALAALGLGSAVALGVASTTTVVGTATSTVAVAGAGTGTAMAAKTTATGLFGLSVAKVVGAVAILSMVVGGAVVVSSRAKDEARSAPEAETQRDDARPDVARRDSSPGSLEAERPDRALPLPATDLDDTKRQEAPSREVTPAPGAAPIPRRTHAEPVPAGARAVDGARASVPEPRAASARKDGSDDGGHAGAKSLAEEVKLLDQARNALAAGDYDACLARLDAHQKRFPHGQLAEQVATTRAAAMKKKSQSKTTP